MAKKYSVAAAWQANMELEAADIQRLATTCRGMLFAPIKYKR